MTPLYVIWSNEHQGWWGPDECGYTKLISAAGRYPREKALAICHQANRHRPETPQEVPVLADDAEEIFGVVEN